MLDFIIISLAIFRITYFLVEEAGPYAVMHKVRSIFNKYEFSPLFCFNCTSIWVSVLLGIFIDLGVVQILSISAGSMFLNNLFQGNNV